MWYRPQLTLLESLSTTDIGRKEIKKTHRGLFIPPATGSAQARLDAARVERAAIDYVAAERAAEEREAANLLEAKRARIERIVAKRVTAELATIAANANIASANVNALVAGLVASTPVARVQGRHLRRLYCNPIAMEHQLITFQFSAERDGKETGKQELANMKFQLSLK
ncbi:hypothetical protein NE237_017962 [Protea cynaroides]|uniref:Uncharacterized protein n=1 Tax=Protea cynaroides TaxID=273540 RepID=A0A9Q0K8Z9_9MAGN|nr:hypothetical protein NE237_017962 [Protea cynaroides]